jgi:hypothetical protein
MKRLALALALILGLAWSSADAQTAKWCLKAATSGNLNCLGVPDSTATVQENLPSVAGTTGQLKEATGSNNTSWVNQSSASYSYLACVPTLSTVSSGTTEQAVATCEIPAGLLGTNGSARIHFINTHVSTSNTDVFQLRIGSANNVSGTSCASANATTSTANYGTYVFANEAATGTNGCTSAGSPSAALTAVNVDTTNPVWVVVTMTPGVSGDTGAGVDLSVEVNAGTGGQ